MKMVESKMRRQRITSIALFAIALMFCASPGGSIEDTDVQSTTRADLLTLDGNKPVGDLERPPVQFPHDLHSEAVAKQDKDCVTCHLLRDDGRLSPLFMRLEGGEDTEKLYHEHCIGCHKDNVAVGVESGPVSCGECHRQTPLYSSSRRPFGLDKSLHYRHGKASNEKCDTCHHIYDEATKELVYIQGREEPCRDCHRDVTEENRSSFRVAAHESCVGCHREIALKTPDEAVGPQSCADCHDAQRQMAIKVVEQPERLKRNQPDFVLLSAQEADLGSSKLNTVPFSHVDHEGFTNNCRVCHHETMARCNECHTLTGDDKGARVTLQQAMHSMTSAHSCVGCHQSEKLTPECAGCHDLMEKGRLSEHACSICHIGPPPEELADVRSLYTSSDQLRPAPPENALKISTSGIPDTVTMGALAGAYPPVKMPHRKIVAALEKRIKDNELATHFHGSESVVCQGCHHHGSVGTKPALCENCHGEPFRVSDLFRPGLKGAYHRQCLGCHVSMELQAVTNCIVCHPSEQTAVGMATRSGGEGASDE
jgi:hypothetical protein